MNKQLLINKLISEDLIRCKKLYKNLSHLQWNLPKGSLVKRHGRLYHSFRQDGKQTQKSITNNTLIQDLKLRQYIKNALGTLKIRIDICQLFLEKNCIYDPLQILADMPEVYHGITDYNIFLEGDHDPSKWKDANSNRNTIPFSTVHYTKEGVSVRSKAEAMIGTELESRSLLFICEPRMSFGSIIKCPDFAILLPKTRKVIYLEHFGRMDDPDYIKDTMEKLLLYSQHGLHLGVNFFFTWETQSKPLTLKEINSTLDQIMALDQ